MTVLPHDWYPGEVPRNVALGKRSWLYSSFAFLHHRSEREPSVRIGPDSGVYVGSYFELGPGGAVKIGRYCSIAGAVFSSNGRIVIGDYTFISYGVVIADTFAAVPPDVRDAVHEDGNREPRDVTIGNDVWIGTRAVVLGGAVVGNGAIIGAAAVVESEVPDYAIAVGNPASIVGWARPGGREERFESGA
jgi:acetyltransferase-like isoleucine patch superfamily enzyme